MIHKNRVDRVQILLDPTRLRIDGTCLGMLFLTRLRYGLGEVLGEVAILAGDEGGHGGLKRLGTRLEGYYGLLWINWKGWNGR